MMADNLNKLATLGVVKKIVEGIKQALPTDLGDLTNTPGYQTGQDVEKLIADKGYQTGSQVQQAISGLASKVTGAVNGHLAALDGNGNLKDSGKSATDFVGSVTGSEQGKIKVDGVDVTVCEIASDTEASAMLDEVLG